jgi:type III pantothenate kinase
MARILLIDNEPSILSVLSALLKTEGYEVMPVREPEKVGVDRLLTALGARALRGAPCIVVSAGTAITADLVDAGGSFAGGAIAPGFHLAARALHEQTSLLPLVEPARPAEPAGRDTISAVQSGVYWSCAGGVLALIERFRLLPGCAGAAVVCTGSDASLLVPVLAEGDSCAEPDLLFKGIAASLGLPL